MSQRNERQMNVMEWNLSPGSSQTFTSAGTGFIVITHILLSTNGGPLGLATIQHNSNPILTIPTPDNVNDAARVFNFVTNIVMPPGDNFFVGCDGSTFCTGNASGYITNYAG